MKKQLLCFCVFFTFLFAVSAEEKLVFTVLITRHGDRTPYANIEKSNYKWDAGVAQLTPEGMNEEFKLGQKLRKHYIGELKFLKKSYATDSIYTVSSNINRTIVSAYCLLTGLYPPGSGPFMEDEKPALPHRIQPIPVRVLSGDSSMICMPYKKYLKILNKYIYNTEVWKNKEKVLKNDFKKWTAILGNKINGLNDVLTIGDVLIVAEHHNMPLPKGLTQEDADKIISLTEWGLAVQFKSEPVAYLMGAELLNDIVSKMKECLSKKEPYKLVYYSGHDITILPIMSLLGSSLDKAPGYASYIQLEVYKNNESYSIKVFYNGKEVKLPLMNGTDSCSIETFYKYVEKLNSKNKDLVKEDF